MRSSLWRARGLKKLKIINWCAERNLLSLEVMKTDEEGLTCRGRSIFLADEFQVFLADFTDLVLKKKTWYQIKIWS